MIVGVFTTYIFIYPSLLVRTILVQVDRSCVITFIDTYVVNLLCYCLKWWEIILKWTRVSIEKESWSTIYLQCSMIITVKDALVILVRLYIFTKIMDRNGNLIRKS